MNTRQHTWDQAHALGVQGGYRRYWARRLVTIVLAVAAGVGFLPGIAHAHYDPGGSHIGGAELEAPHEAIGAQGFYVGPYPVPVSGRGFVATDKVHIFLCPRGETDLLNDCLAVGAVLSDSNGDFSTQAVVPSFRLWRTPSGNLNSCQTKFFTFEPYETVVECSMVAATYDPLLQQPTSMAEHYVCFGFSVCTTNRDGTPTTTTTSTTMPPPPPPEWQPAAPMNVARDNPGTAVGADGRIYALGGKDAAGNAITSAETLDPCGDKKWSLIAPMPTPRTDFATSGGADGRIYVIGGREPDGTHLSSVDAYDPATNTWSTAASLVLPRYGVGATTGPDGLLYAIEGKDAFGEPAATHSVMVEAYDTAVNQWRTVTPLPHVQPEVFGPRPFAKVVKGPDDRIYAIGWGWAQSYSPGSAGRPGTWQEEPEPPSDTYLGAATTGPDGLIYAIGGGGRTVRVYNTTTKTWTMSPEALSISRGDGNGAATGKDGRIYALGGTDRHWDPVLNDYVGGPMASTEAQQVAPSSCPPGRPPADFDGDADTDVSVFRPSSGTWFVKDGTSRAWGTEGDIPVPGDYDGDAKVDQAIFRPSTGLWAIHGSGGVDTFVTYGIGTDIPVPADYDGDAKTDIAIFRPAYGTWWMRHSATGIDVPITFGISGDVPVPGDYDGDAKADLGIYRAGSWFTLPSSGGAYTSQSYGGTGDIPVPADYDADHRTDVAIFRPSDGTWSLHRSSDDADEVFSFGISGDVPVPGDYNADGIADPAVYRNGQWFIETGQTHSWGIATDIPLPLPYAIRSSFR